MANIRFNGFWSGVWQTAFNRIQKTNDKFIILQIADDYFEKIKPQLDKLNDIQSKKGELRELDVDIEFHFKKRTLNQNKLLHSLIGLIVSETNGIPRRGKVFDQEQERFYMDLMANYAAVKKYQGDKSVVDLVKLHYRLIKNEVEIYPGVFAIEVYVSTSHMTTKEIAIIIDHLFDMLFNMVDMSDNARMMLDKNFNSWQKHCLGGKNA